MKAFIAILVGSITLSAQAAETLCFTWSTAQLFPDGKRYKISAELSNDGQELRVQLPSGSTWAYTRSSEIHSAPQAQRLCRQRIENLMQARALIGLQAAREGNPLALVFLLPMGLAPVTSTDCALLSEMTVFKDASKNQGDSPLGATVGISQSSEGLLLFEDNRGLVYQPSGCNSARRQR